MKNYEAVENANLKIQLQNDNVFVKQQVVNLSSLTDLPSRRGLEKAIISEDQIVNVVSKSYAHLPNENFFSEVEAKLVESRIGYITRSINRENRSFAVDYILSDDNWIVKVKNGSDKHRPMLRFTNSYDGSCRTSGHFGFFREICSNGLHTAQSEIGFSVKHRGDIMHAVIPEITEMIGKFMANEFYSIHRKFEVLAERPINNLNDFVRATAHELKLFQFECSKKNSEPSLNARIVLDTIQKESALLNTEPTLWIGYNAFNALLHGKLKKTFQAQKNLDAQILETVFTY